MHYHFLFFVRSCVMVFGLEGERFGARVTPPRVFAFSRLVISLVPLPLRTFTTLGIPVLEFYDVKFTTEII